jgi:hypothetical protein
MVFPLDSLDSLDPRAISLAIISLVEDRVGTIIDSM